MEGISLDTNSLSKMADALSADRHAGRMVVAETDDVDSPSIDDEACTIDPVGDTTTRGYPSITDLFGDSSD
jgi:hypothetical protein